MATTAASFSTLSLHDALPISERSAPRGLRRVDERRVSRVRSPPGRGALVVVPARGYQDRGGVRSEEHTSELQSHVNLVCRLLLEKKKTIRMSEQPMVSAATS